MSASSDRWPARSLFCSDCGARHTSSDTNPLSCACGADTYFNPKPVVVIVAPVDGGLLCIRRAIPPQVGKLALPGGFLIVGEDWREGAVREMQEETGMVHDPADVRLFTLSGFPVLHSVPGNNLLIVVRLPWRAREDVPLDHRNDETLGTEIVSIPLDLAFPVHTAALRHFLSEQPGGRW